MVKYVLMSLGVAGLLVLVVTPQGSGPAIQQERFVVRVPEDFPTIQAAIDAVAEGGTVLIGPGTYQENLQIDKTLSLMGAGSDQVVITPVPTDPDRPHVAIRWGKNPPMVAIEGMSFLNTREEAHSIYGVSVGALAAILKNVKISGYSVGIQTGASELHIEAAMIRRNTIGFWQVRGHTTIINSTVLENETGIKGSSLLVSRDNISHNRTGIHIIFPPKAISHPPDPFWEGIIQHQVTILSNQIAENEIGILIGEGIPIDSYYPEGVVIVPDLLRIEGNHILNNQKYGVSFEGWQCLCTDESTDEGYLGCLLVTGEIPSRILLPATEPNNEIEGNNKADLCPADYPWPPGFRK